MEEQDMLHDHSTLTGRIQALYHRMPWRVVAAGTVAVVVFTAIAILLNAVAIEDTPEAVPSAKQRKLLLRLDAPTATPGAGAFNTASGTFDFEGTDVDHVLRSLDLSPADLLKLKHLRIQNVIIDAAELTKSLQGASNLESIEITALDTIGDFRRVELPKLKRFYYNYLHHANSDDFKPADVMQNILFFDTGVSSSGSSKWDYMKDVLNQKVNITVWIDGTVILDIDRASGVININTHYCQELLENVRGNFTKLVMSWCKFTNVNVVPPTLRYLNLNNAVPHPYQLANLLKTTTQLQEFHAFQPYIRYDPLAPTFYVTPDDPTFQTPVDVGVFPPTLKVVSLVRLALTSDPSSSNPVTTNVQELTLEECNVTSAVLQGFPRIFKNLQILRVFNAQGLLHAQDEGSFSTILTQALLTDVATIVVTEFKPSLVSSDPTLQEQLAYLQMLNTTNFIMQKNNTRNSGFMAWVARPLTDLEVNYKRFEHFRFQDIDTYDDYLMYDSFKAVSSSASGNFEIPASLLLVLLVFRNLLEFIN